MNIGKLEKVLEENNQPKFRLDQIKKAVYEDGCSRFSEISNLPKDLRETLQKEIKILSFETEKMLVSADKASVKAVLKLEDGEKIETVLISPRPESWSVCLSCQAGCPMNCAFCATGQMGFKRNLTAEEIYDQVLFWKQYLNKVQISNNKSQINPKSKIKNSAISNIVYMGMGEPFLNWEAVSESLNVLMDRKGLNFGSRSISISTAGVKGGIKKMAEEFPQINLAVSLHFPENVLRGRFMPSNASLNLNDLRDELENYFSKCNRKVFLEYILFDRINDGEKNSADLLRYVKSFKKTHLLHVNLIRYNETSGKFKPSSSAQAQKFKDYLLQNKINTTVRKSLGGDIQGACGQLASNA